MAFGQITIVGVGLIGGSIGLAAKLRGLAKTVVGVGRDEHTLARAKADGAIDHFSLNLAEASQEADLIIICTPVDRIAADVRTAATSAPRRCVITDVGSTKFNIAKALAGTLSPNAAPYVGSHPLAGSEKRGAANAKADLFADRVVVVTPTSETDVEATAVVELFWQNLGARIVRMAPQEHDEALAFTSHLPHAAASALAAVTPVSALHLTAGGFRDTTRIAAADPELWAAIFEANRDAMLSATHDFLQRIQAFQTHLQAGDHAALVQWLTEGKRVRDALGS